MDTSNNADTIISIYVGTVKIKNKIYINIYNITKIKLYYVSAYKKYFYLLFQKKLKIDIR